MNRDARPTRSLVKVVPIRDLGDDRGVSFSVRESQLRFLGQIRDVHCTSIRPGKRRGDHYHRERREILFVLHEDKWELRWDCGPETAPNQLTFEGTAAVMVQILPSASHSLINTGSKDLYVIELSDLRYDRAQPDVCERALV